MILRARDDGVLKDIVAKIVKLHVNPGVDRLQNRVPRIGGNVVILPETTDRAEIRQDKALKSPLATENRIE